MANAIKLIFILAIVLFSACKKTDWQCTCNVSGSYYGLGTVTYTITHASESSASKTCEDHSKTLTSPYGAYNCSISEL